MDNPQNEYRNHLIDELVELRNEQHHCDFKIICEDDRTIHCHLLVLAAGSAYFEEHLRARSELLKITEYAAPVVEDIINFIYTGAIKFTRKYAKDILVAAQYFKLRRLDLVDELGVRYILGEVNAMPDMVDLFLYLMTDPRERTLLIQGLSRHIMTFFDEFKADAFADFDVAEWMALLNQSWYLPAGEETEFLRSFARTLEKKEEKLVYLDKDDRRLYLDQANIRRMVFGYYRDDYSLWLSRRFAAPYETQAYQWQETDWQDNLVTYSLPALHVYVREVPSAETHIFYASRASPSSWTKVAPGVLYHAHKAMASIAINDNVYRLGNTGKRLTFFTLNSITDADIRKLRSPPTAAPARFELCKTRDSIYLTTFDRPTPEVETRSSAAGSDGIDLYRYDIATNEWFAVSLPMKQRCQVATVTAYEDRVYLIARASNSDHYPILYTLNVDSKWQWVVLGQCSLDHHVRNMTSCGHDGSIYVCSSHRSQEPKIERFDLKSEMWEDVAPLHANVDYVHRLISFENWLWAIAKSKDNTCIVRTYNTYSKTWEPSPFNECIQSLVNVQAGSSLHFLDSFIYKPMSQQV